MKLGLIALVLCSAAGVAHADPHWDGAVVYQVGSFPIGTQANLALGTRLEAGMHLGGLGVLGEYTFYDLDPQNGPSWSASAHRIGATVRYGVPLGPFGSSLWAELGAGEQLYGIGAAQTRRDFAVGLGFQRSFWNPRATRRVGYFIALRMTQAPGPTDPDAPMPLPASTTCRGSCPTMAPAPGADRSFLFTAGVTFGN